MCYLCHILSPYPHPECLSARTLLCPSSVLLRRGAKNVGHVNLNCAKKCRNLSGIRLAIRGPCRYCEDLLHLEYVSPFSLSFFSFQELRSQISDLEESTSSHQSTIETVDEQIPALEQAKQTAVKIRDFKLAAKISKEVLCREQRRWG